MIVRGLMVLAVLLSLETNNKSAPPDASEAPAASQAEFKRAWLEANSYFSDKASTLQKAYVERQMPATNALTRRVVSRYGKPLSNSDSEVVLKINQVGKVQKVLVDQNSHLRTLFEEECKLLQLERPPNVPFYLGVAIGTPGVP